ncbi:MAG: hypothetical protein ACKOWD_01605 [Rhodoferax sp.]
MDIPKWTDVVSAIAASISALAVIFAMFQIRTTKVIHQLQFEDGLDKEYRDLVARIPTKALLGSGLAPEEYTDSFDEFYRYVDLCNQQIFLRQRKRVGSAVWIEWCEGMRCNLVQLPAFRRAWGEIKSRCDSFQELRRLENENFCSDPANWTKGE